MTDYRENKDVRRPFVSTPDPRVYFPASSIASARRDMTRCLARGEGVAIATGGAGVGKTLLARSIATEFESVDLVAVVSASRRLNVKAFLQQTLFSLRQTFAGADETELRLMTFDYLEHSAHERFALIVDDAQNLTLRVFDEIRALVDHCASTIQTSVALLGSPTLETRLNAPSLFSFQQRIVSRSYLENFEAGEVAKFIARELQRASVDAVFTEDAVRLVEKYSDRAPRVVVQLCDRALFLATEAAKERQEEEGATLQIGEQEVEIAWRNLQNIAESEGKTPRTTSDEAPSEETDVVEFGDLDDDEDGDEPISANAPQSPATPSNDAAPSFTEPAAPQATENPASQEKTAPTSASVESDALVDELEEELDEELEDVPGEIDSDLEARLLAKLAQKQTKSQTQDATPTEEERECETNPMKQNTDYSSAARPRRRRELDATYLAAPSVDLIDEADSGLFDASLSFDSEGSAEFVANPPSVTRRPIVDGEDGAREFRDVNGFNAEDSARFAADDRYLESQFRKAPRDSSLRNWGDPAPDEPQSLEDRAYRQIVASCYRSAADFPASDQYLNELRLLEQEIAEEANLIRRIRNIHLQLRAARDPLAQGQAK